MSNRSKMRRPAGSNPNSNRGPGRPTIDTGSGVVPTGLPAELAAQVEGQHSALRVMAANQGLGEPVLSRVTIGERVDGGEELQAAGFDPDLAFGQPQELREDPLPQGATVSDVDESVSEARTKRASSTGSSRDGVGVPNPLRARGRAKVLAKLGEAGFEAVSGLLNERLALDDEDETWLADEDDTEAIGDPAGRLLARRLPLPEGVDTSDLIDAIDIGIAVAGYLIKNAMARARLIRARRRALREGQAVVHPEA